MDRIGSNAFIRLSGAPERVSQEWEIAARSGVSGLALWNTGARGRPFAVDSEAVALTFAIGRTYLFDYQALERSGPVQVWFGTLEVQQLYKVLRVQLIGPGVKRVVRAHVANDPNVYTALVFARWELLPLDPFVQRP